MTAQTFAKEKSLIPSHVRRSNTSEQFLEDISEAIQIPEGRYEEAANRYKSLKTWLTRNESILKYYNPEVSLQGSFKLGTVIKPVCEEEEYDIDLVCTTALTKSRITQERLKVMLGAEIQGYAKAHNMQDPESKRRCWRVQYAQDAQFHLDALPAIPESELPRLLLEGRGVDKDLISSAIAITDEEHQQYRNISEDWPSSNPEGYSKWFYGRMQAVFHARRMVLAEAAGKREEEIPEYKVKTPLQSAIQILKRHRDMTHDGEIEDRPISIIITTLAAKAYGQETTISGALYSILSGMECHIENRNGEYWIPNPTNPEENFADKWKEFPIRREKFFEWLERAKTDFVELASLMDKREIAEAMAPVLGKRLVESAINRQQKALLEAYSYSPLRILDPEHRKKPKWEMALVNGKTAKISAHRKQLAGFRKINIESDGVALPKGCKLNFVAETNVSEPYDVYWQVVNTGSQAREKKDLRGEFGLSTAELGSNVRQETTAYKGSHSVECFIIKKDVCVARSGQFVVNIR